MRSNSIIPKWFLLCAGLVFSTKHTEILSQCAVAAPADVSIPCGSSTTIVAPNNQVTYSYVASSCSPIPITGTNAFGAPCDDCVTGNIPIGFPFNFYGNVYTDCQIQSNGIVGFGGLTYTGFSGFSIPAAGNPNNYIAGLYADIDIRCGGTITYQSIGVAPNRQFVVSYDNVSPYGSGTPTCNGTGTASFQVVLNENGSFQTIISQLSANWASNLFGTIVPEITQGAENINGTYAFPIPGRNNQDIGGIVPGNQDCYTFNPGVCVFQRWEQGGSILTTSTSLTVSPTVATTYTGVWNCAGYTCSDDVVVNIAGPSMATSAVTNNTDCSNPNGSFNLTLTNFANGTYTLNYTLNGAAQTRSVTVTSASQVVNFTGLSAGAYSNFSIASGCNSATLNTTATISSSFSTPALSVTGTANSTDCVTPNGTISLSLSNIAAGTHTVSYSASGTPASTSMTVGGMTSINQSTTFNSATIDLTDPTYMRSVAGTTYSASTLVNYETFTFVPSATGSYTFNNTYVGDAHASIYSSPFTPGSPATNFVIADDDGNGGSDPRITVTLTAGQTYVLVTSTFGSGSTGAFSWIYTGPGGATISSTSGAATTTITNLAPGTYTNFTVGTGCNQTVIAGPFTITGPSTPTTTGVTICPGASGNLSVSSTCPSGSQTQTASGSGGTSNAITYGGAGNTNITIAFPALPAGATVTAVTTTISFATNSPSWRSEVRVEATPPAGALQNDLQPSTLASGGSVTNAAFGSWGTTNPVGNWLFRFRETANDGTPNPDANITNITITVTYTLTNTLQWYTVSSGGSAIGTGTPFNPVGVAGSGLSNTNTPGTTTYYAACSANPGCRTATTFVINNASTAATSISGGATICVGNAVSLSVNGGSLAAGSNWEWFSGSCGGTPAGTGSSITVSPTSTTTYYVRASAVGGCPATACVNTTVTLPTQGTSLAQNGESATCVVNANNYIHFYHSSGRLILSINSLGQNLGNVTATAYTGSPVDVYDCTDPSYVKTALGRHWVVTPQFQPNSPIDIVFHFDQTEFSALVPAANGNTSAEDNLSVIGDLKLSKYSGPANVDDLASNNCPALGGNGGTTLHNQTTSGNTTSLIPAFGSSGRYALFSIPGFSEMWLHGVSNNSPLPVTLSTLYGTCENNIIEIHWATVSETNSDKFIIEKYRGDSWVKIGEMKAAGQSTEKVNYSFTDTHFESYENIYRLKQVDFNGDATFYAPLNVNCTTFENKLELYPNPNQGDFVIQISSELPDKSAFLEITDVSGKTIYGQELSLNAGMLLLPVQLDNLSNGSYFVKIRSVQNQYQPVKLIKN